MEYLKKQSKTFLNLYCCMHRDCESEYSTKFNLKKHVESVHMNVKRFKCPSCYVYFSSKQSLQEHANIHTGAMPFKCTLCQKNFRQASQLSLHKRVHITEGKKSDYVKVLVSEEILNVKPIEICMEVDREKLKLPEISEQRHKQVLLPFPLINT